MATVEFDRNHRMQAFGYPLRKVTRTGVSPMNPKVKYADVDCGHTVYLSRKPKVGAMIACGDCKPKED